MAEADDARDKRAREYPDTLRQREQIWQRLRREAVLAHERSQTPIDQPSYPGNIESRPPVGLALSGGGIRSATFGLGVIQALAKLSLLRRIDYLSTASGGGYIGAFLGRLYSRHYATPHVVEYLLHPERGSQTRPRWSLIAQTETDPEKIANRLRIDPFHWLRENGRYLAPNGGGDMLTAFSVAVRSWVALQLVTGSFLLMILMVAQVLRIVFEGDEGLARLLGQLPPIANLLTAPEGLLCWSPWVNGLVPLLLLFVLPPGLGYWLVERHHGGQVRQWRGVAAILVLPLLALILDRYLGLPWQWWVPVLITGLSTVIYLQLSVVDANAVISKSGIDATPEDFRDLRRTRLSYQLSFALAAAAGLAVFSVIDTLGQTLYSRIMDGDAATAWLPALLAASTPIAMRVLRVPARLSALGGGKTSRLRVPVEIVAIVAAVLLTLVVLSALDALAHAFAWGFADPSSLHGFADLWFALPVLGALLVFSAVSGRNLGFLNGSSHSALYASRLSRAYLGASNWRRFLKGDEAAVTDNIPFDDAPTMDYFEKAVRNGGPLHFINVTINETAGRDAKTVLRDRKGIGMAVGPCGLSAGVRHHALHEPDFPKAPGVAPDEQTPLRLLPLKSGDPADPEYCMFDRTQPGSDCTEAEKLSLKQWIAISGAAMTTGLGSRTTIAMSLLYGFANVRLGYWWDAGRRPHRSSGLRSAWRWAFPVQNYLLNEFTATFHGPEAQSWYLSDGGHFENMAAYELIRRRLPMIVIVDGEADPDYTYEGLANLVRKARLDFGANIGFLDNDALTEILHPDIREAFGDLDDLRPLPPEGYSARDAALAVVTYDGSSERSLIVYIKPSLAADDPTDVREYRAKHEDFPQQSTSDQFFDESQWESYRKLGEVIATRVFAKAENTLGGFLPNNLWPGFRDEQGEYQRWQRGQ